MNIQTFSKVGNKRHYIKDYQKYYLSHVQNFKNLKFFEPSK